MPNVWHGGRRTEEGERTVSVSMNEKSNLVELAPDFDVTSAASIAKDLFGVVGNVRDLRSERDRNFIVSPPAVPGVVLKITNSAEDPAVVDMEQAAMEHVRRTAPLLPIPRVVRTLDGALSASVLGPDGRSHLVRMLTVVPGSPADQASRAPAFAGHLGHATAEMAKALQGFAHPASTRAIEWDPRRVNELRSFVSRLPTGRQEPITSILDRLADLPERASRLPSQPLHCDLTLTNVLIGDGGEISGLIDFGDIHHTARASDLAISLASLLRESGDLFDDATRYLDGYQRVIPLEPEEVALIPDLVLGRLAASVLISAWRAELHPGNLEYVTSLDAGSWRALDGLTAYGFEASISRFQRICGTSRLTPARQADRALLERRGAAMGGGLTPLFYDQPVHMVRGDGPWLVDASGRRYLDAYNNVPVVGHEHPAVAQAIARQVAILNTNSRYLHANVVELAERITASLPGELDTCVFVNSGSEANDLAWRMATAFTGHSGAIITDSAYHGVSEVTAALSSNTWMTGYQPDFVATISPPHAERDGSPRSATQAEADIAAARSRLGNRGLALTAVDPMFTSGGILEAGDEFMTALLKSTHGAGGLFLADEVQAGFGRGGRGLWRFADFSITPDFVTLGKPMGNGHPIAALITRREIADRFARTEEYFSTFGGNPVSCAAALTVLDVIEDSGLIARSGRSGERLRTRLARLRDKHPAIGEIRGQGLIAGVEIVHGGPGTSRAATTRIVELLRVHHVLVGSTGLGGNVLKIRPPLIWEDEHVDAFVSALGKALFNHEIAV
jgi:4-aminobutyrate aminotransferase-like enzyme/Ser/Thr protein kinase RdoA (MazF antagonist)